MSLQHKLKTIKQLNANCSNATIRKLPHECISYSNTLHIVMGIPFDDIVHNVLAPQQLHQYCWDGHIHNTDTIKGFSLLI